MVLLEGGLNRGYLLASPAALLAGSDLIYLESLRSSLLSAALSAVCGILEWSYVMLPPKDYIIRSKYENWLPTTHSMCAL